MQKNQLIDLKQNLERFVNTLPIFGSNSGRYDLNMIKSYLIPYLINDKEAEPMVIKKANDFISFQFGDIQFLDIMKFLGGATSLGSFLKAYKASELKKFFPYEWFDSANELENEELPPYEAFFSKLRNNNPLDKDFQDYQKLRSSGLDKQKVLKKLQIKSVPATGWENYKKLQEIWQKHGKTTFRDFLQWYNNKNVAPTLEAMQKTVQFYHQRENYMLKLGCTFPNLANICLHKSLMKNSTHFAKMVRICAWKLERIWRVDHQLCLREKLLWMKLLSGIHQISANQSLELMPASSIPIQCQHDYTLDGSLIPICKNSRLDITDLEALRTWWCLTTKKQDQNAELRFHTSGNQKKIDCFNVDGYCDHFKTVFEAMRCYYLFFLARRLVPHLAIKILREEKMRGMDDLRR